MKAVFADAFYFVALLNRADQHHARTVVAARQLREPLLTTEWVLTEFADALAESTSRRLVLPFIRSLERDSQVTQPGVVAAGLAALRRARGQTVVADGLHFLCRDGGGGHHGCADGRPAFQAGGFSGVAGVKCLPSATG